MRMAETSSLRLPVAVRKRAGAHSRASFQRLERLALALLLVVRAAETPCYRWPIAAFEGARLHSAIVLPSESAAAGYRNE